MTHSGANTHNTTGQGCFDGPSATSCWLVSSGKYTTDGTTSNEATCASTSCDGIGCKDSATCVDNCGSTDNQPFCHLCPDKLCTECDTYTACKAGACATNASNDGNICACDEGFVREVDSVVNETCTACFTNCGVCSDSTADFSVCTECMTGTVNTIAASGAYKFCESQCPTGYTESSSKQCTTSDTFIANI